MILHQDIFLLYPCLFSLNKLANDQTCMTLGGLKEDQTNTSINMTIVDDLIILGVRFEKVLKEKIDRNLKLKKKMVRGASHRQCYWERAV